MSFRGIDHVAVVVADLDAAIERYTQLGFTVIRGGRHPNGSHNAFMSFSNGSVLELFGFLDPATPNEHRYWNELQRRGEGLCDWCMESDDLGADVAALRAANIGIDDPIDRSRTRPDGIELRWRVAITQPAFRRVVPFLIHDITERALRNPPPTEHANGCTGITEITIAVSAFDVPRAWASAVTGKAPAAHGDAIEVRIGTQRLRWAMLGAPDDGPFALSLACNGSSRDVDPAAACGARLRFVGI